MRFILIIGIIITIIGAVIFLEFSGTSERIRSEQPWKVRDVDSTHYLGSN